MTDTHTALHSRWTSRRSARGRLRYGIAGLMLSLAFAGCGGAGEGGAVAEGDSTGIGGLSPEQLQEQAQPMSREQAEQLGIVDTTEAAPPSPVGPGSTAPGAGTDSAAPPAP